MLGRPEWRDDPRFRDQLATAWPTSPRSPTLMNAVLAHAHLGRVDRGLRCGRRSGRPGAPIGDALDDPQALARGMVVDGAPAGGARPRRSAARSTFRRRRPPSSAQRRCSASTRARYWVSTVTTMPRSTVSSPTVSRPDGHAYRRQAGIEMSRSVSSTFFSSATARSPSATMPTRLRALSTTGIRRIWCSPIRARTT